MPGRKDRLLGLVIAIAVLTALGSAAGTATAAGPAPELSMAGKNRNCDTDPGTTKPDTCRVATGSMFTAQISLDKLAGLVDADGDTKAGWTWVQVHMLDTANLTLNDGLPYDEAVNCSPGTTSRAGGDGDFGLTCGLQSGQNERLDTGLMFEIDYTCNASGAGAVTMIHDGGLDSHVGNENFAGIPDDDGLEVLTIECAYLWDVNGDGVVSAGDIAWVVGLFGQTVPPASIVYDVNSDGVMSAADIAEVVGHYGEMTPP
jgi:hypothetical protein